MFAKNYFADLIFKKFCFIINENFATNCFRVRIKIENFVDQGKKAKKWRFSKTGNKKQKQLF